MYYLKRPLTNLPISEKGTSPDTKPVKRTYKIGKNLGYFKSVTICHSQHHLMYKMVKANSPSTEYEQNVYREICCTASGVKGTII